MRHVRSIVLGAVFFVTFAVPARAVPITLEIAGVISGTSGVLGSAPGVFVPGVDLRWELTYDSALASPGPPGSHSFGAPLPSTSFDWRVFVAGSLYEWSNVGQTRLFTDGTGSTLGIDTSSSGLAVDGPSLLNPFLLFPIAFDGAVLFGAPVVAPFTLPMAVTSQAVGGGFSLMFAPCDNCAGPSIGFVNGRFLNIREVPEPSTLLLVGLGAAGVYRWRRTRA
jgi:PEP-CTERM motif